MSAALVLRNADPGIDDVDADALPRASEPDEDSARGRIAQRILDKLRIARSSSAGSA